MSPAASGTGLDNPRYVRPLGSADDGEYAVAVTPTATNPVDGWEHTSLRVAWCAAGGHVEHDPGDEETLVVPLVGSWRVEVTEADGTTHDVDLPGRGSVFEGPTDVVYAGRGSRLRVTSTSTLLVVWRMSSTARSRSSISSSYVRFSTAPSSTNRMCVARRPWRILNRCASRMLSKYVVMRQSGRRRTRCEWIWVTLSSCMVLE